MSNTANRFCLMVILLGFAAHHARCQAYGWMPLGPSDTDKPSFATAYWHAMTTFQNEPYIIFLDDNTNKLVVRRHTAKGWQTISDRNFAASYSTNNEIAADHTGNIYVACNRGKFEYASVQKWDGSSWTVVGKLKVTSAGPVQYLNLAVSASGTPYVAYLDTARGNALVVEQWDGTDWVDVGTGIVDSQGVRGVDLAIDYAGSPVVAYGSMANGYKAKVRKWNGSAWVTLGNPDISLGGLYSIRLILKKDGTPYIGYADQKLHQSVIMRLEGTGVWKQVGQPYWAYDGGDIAFDRNDTLYEVHGDYGSDFQLILRRYSDTAYTNIAHACYQYVQAPLLAIGSSNTPYIATSESFSSSPKEIVMRYNGSVWEDLAGVGLAGQPSLLSAMTIDGKGQPYVFSIGLDKADSGIVMKYDGSRWISLNSPNVWRPAQTQLYAGIEVIGQEPYVIYTSGHYAAVRVKRYNGKSWESVGDSLQLPAAAAGLDITADSSGHPVIAVAQTCGLPVVMKFDGINWVTMGTLDSIYSYDIRIAIDKHDTPYVLYHTRWATPVTVQKFDGHAWESLYMSSMYPYSGYMAEMALDTAGLPYLFFKGDYDWPVVYRYDGSQWSKFGSEVSSDRVRAYSIAIDADNTVYVAYTDDQGNFETWAKRASMATPAWETIGHEPVSSGMSRTDAHIAVMNGAPIVTWSNFGVYAKKYLPPSSLTVSTTHNLTGQQLHLYPNPATGNIFAGIAGKPDQNIRLSIYDATGRICYTQQVITTANTNIKLPVANFAKGIYWVTIRNGQETTALSFIKQ